MAGATRAGRGVGTRGYQRAALGDGVWGAGVSGLAKQLAKIGAYIRKWEKRGYPEGIPDEAPAELEAIGKVPSYRLICLTILKNDVACETLGYAREKCQAYMELKRIEIMNRRRV